MKFLKNLPAVALAALLAVCLFAYYSTREFAPVSTPDQSEGLDWRLVDTGLLQNAVKMAPLAATPEEQMQAREAWRLADHELDLTFAGALRQAGAEAEAAQPATEALRQLGNRIKDLEARVAADKKRVAELGKEAGAALDMAHAQLDVDQDELDDLQQDRARQGGDKRAKLQRLLQEHEASDKVADQNVKFSSPEPTGTMSDQVRAWLSLGRHRRELGAAAQEAEAHARMLLEQHNTLERKVPSQRDEGASMQRLRQLSGQQKTLSSLDQRLQDTKQLAGVYQRWSSLIRDRRRAVLHLMLQSLAAILGILLTTLVLNHLVRHAFHKTDQRRIHQLRVIGRITLQAAAALLILLVIFGPPKQLSTMVGLLTAGLAVVMKDFIVSFFGWFTLMGKDGISVGDWVEIEGVSGEVIQIGLLKTVLLELGNWTESGHPTGRRVTFSNSFAMERHYFNFSTSGQWLWDEVRLPLPASGNPYQIAQKIREIVERETQADAAEAAADWQRVTRQYGAREFSAGPAVNLRPGVNVLEVVVRYITRAPRRNAVRSKLFQAIVDLFRAPGEVEAGSAAAPVPGNGV